MITLPLYTNGPIEGFRFRPAAVKFKPMNRGIIVLVALLLGLAGCTKQPAAPGAAGSHAHAAPHGGVLVELGDHEASLEFKFDAPRGILQAWVLDAHAENFVRTSQRSFEVEAVAGGRGRLLDFVAVANTLTGETVGDTALFEVEAAWLRDAKAFDGRVKAITVRGKTFRDVAFTYREHDAHEH
jgi:hypothetical protein